MTTDPELKRQTRGLAIASIYSCVRRINKLRYKVKSQSDAWKWYDVIKQYGHNIGGHEDGEWTCTCPDFTYRHIICKHIYGVCLSKELRRKIVQEEIAPPVVTKPVSLFNIYEKCQAEGAIIKHGYRHNKNGDIQRYQSTNCNHKFIINFGFEKARANPKTVTAALDLYFKGISLRKVCDHLQQFFSIKPSHATIINWIRKFVDVVKPYVDSIEPRFLSGIYHVDEMLVHTKREKMEWGHYQWLWNLMDDTTRFWITTKISQRREVADAGAVFQDSKSKIYRPKAVIHDGLKSYDEAFQKEYFSLRQPRVKNIRSISVRGKGLNSKVERLHGTCMHGISIALRRTQAIALLQQVFTQIRYMAYWMDLIMIQDSTLRIVVPAHQVRLAKTAGNNGQHGNGSCSASAHSP